MTFALGAADRDGRLNARHGWIERGAIPAKRTGRDSRESRPAIEAPKLGDTSVARRLGLRIRLIGAAALGHELIELGAVLGETQPRQEILELPLLLLETLQCLRAVFVEGAVAAGRRAEPVAAACETVHPVAHSVHLFLQAGHLAFPTVPTVIPVEHRRIPCVR